MKIARRLIGLGILGAVCGAATFHWAVSSSTASTKGETLKTVAAAKVERADLARNVTFSAEFRPYQEADLHAKVAGYVKEMKVDIGDQVKSGQVLATLDVPELNDELAHADAAFRDASLDYERLQAVVKQQPGLVAQQDIDTAEAHYKMAQANRQRAATMVSYATITAPFDGIITMRYVDPGALVQPGTSSNSQPVVHIAQNTLLRLDFPVPEPDVPEVHVGTPVNISVEATGQTLHGKIVRMSGKLETSTRTMQTEVDVENKDLRLAPGMYASATVILESRPDVLSLPLQAVSLGKEPTVWLIDKDGVIHERPVKVGMSTDTRVEILSGLQEGDVVVFGNRGVASVGQKVRPKLMANTGGSGA